MAGATETKAVQTQTRPPRAVKSTFVRDPDKHYVLVEVESTRLPDWQSPYDQMMGTISETDPSADKYEDLGYIPGECKERNQHMLVCSKADHIAELKKSHADSIGVALGTVPLQGTRDGEIPDGMTIKRSAPRSIESLDVSQEADPITKY